MYISIPNSDLSDSNTYAGSHFFVPCAMFQYGGLRQLAQCYAVYYDGQETLSHTACSNSREPCPYPSIVGLQWVTNLASRGSPLGAIPFIWPGLWHYRTQPQG